MEHTKVIQLHQDVTLENVEDVSITLKKNIIDIGGKFNSSDKNSVNLRLYDFGGHRGKTYYIGHLQLNKTDPMSCSSMNADGCWCTPSNVT